jgi:glycerol kinase
VSAHIATLDQGTTSSRVIIFDADARPVASAQRELQRFFPADGWVEQSADEIWSTQIACLTEALARAGLTASDLSGIAIANQRETTILWDRATGRPVAPAIVWQCRRSADYITDLVERGLAATIRRKTGLIPDAYFSASKLAWLLDHIPDARRRAAAGQLAFGTVDTWLIWNLTAGRVHVTDTTNASRTMLFNIHTLKWDDELLALFDIDRSLLPQVTHPSGLIATTDSARVGDALPIVAVMGDQQAALFGQCAFDAGAVKNTYGTGCFLLMNTGTTCVESDGGLLTTIAWSDDTVTHYALEGSVFTAGSAIKWLRDGLGLIQQAADTDAIARSVDDAAGLHLVPAFTGLGAPWWDSEARGMLTGITQAATAAHLVRATLESLAFQSADVLELMRRESGRRLSVMGVDGGAAANDFLMQFQADLLGCELHRPECIETTALGAAYAAGLALGVWSDRALLCRQHRVQRVFTPQMTPQAAARRKEAWHAAVARTLTANN